MVTASLISMMSLGVFGIWQDLNIDGLQQEGEFYDLDHWGIESISLEYRSDSSTYLTANGNVQVFGQSEIVLKMVQQLPPMMLHLPC